MRERDRSRRILRGRVSPGQSATITPAARSAERVLAELRQLERELVELAYVRRADAVERVREAVGRLGDAGAPDGLLERAAEELVASSQLDRVLIGEVDEGALVARALAVRDDRAGAQAALDELRGTPIRLDYPLIEAEVAQRQRAVTVAVGASGRRAAPRLAEVLGWDAYVVAPIALHGGTVGLLHADAGPSGRTVDAVDREVVALFAAELAGVVERSVLRDTLRRHREELRAAVQWMSSRLTQLAADGPAPEAGAPPVASGPATAAGADVDALTPRELEVLRLLARGQTNLAIARALVVSEGTVKYHVKNILRKLRATSRAEAVARYLRADGAAPGP
jgi:DNA-binding CsgD family transcriptional regulator